MQCSLDHNTPPSAELSESSSSTDVKSPSTSSASTSSASSSRPEPTRGVKKTPSLRRGGAAYAQLLHSAVMASIECRSQHRQDEEQDTAAPIRAPPSDAMQVEHTATFWSSRSHNKRPRHAEGRPHKATHNNRRHRDEEDDDDDDAEGYKIMDMSF
jgi:hypothetical protein